MSLVVKVRWKSQDTTHHPELHGNTGEEAVQLQRSHVWLLNIIKREGCVPSFWLKSYDQKLLRPSRVNQGEKKGKGGEQVKEGAERWRGGSWGDRKKGRWSFKLLLTSANFWALIKAFQLYYLWLLMRIGLHLLYDQSYHCFERCLLERGLGRKNLQVSSHQILNHQKTFST